MISGAIYVVMLLLIFFMLFCSIYGIFQYVPSKIKTISYILLAMMFLRVITLVIFLSVANLKYLYFFKFFYYINYSYIFGVVILLFYIFLRSDSFKLIYVYIAFIAFALLNIIIEVCFGTQISIYKGLCYAVYPENKIAGNLIYTLIYFGMLVILIYNFRKKKINTVGMVQLIIVCAVLFIENILALLNIYKMPSYIIGDFLCMTAFLYGINCFRKQYKYKS